MPNWPTIRRRLAAAASLALIAGLLVVLPISPLGSPTPAHAAVAAGDVIYEQDGLSDAGVYQYKHSDGSSTQLVGDTYAPDISPDGSRIVLLNGNDLYVANADGSAATQITFRIPIEDNLGGEGGQAFGYGSYNPRWSPDGQWIVYTKYSNATGNYKLKKVHPDGTGNSVVLSENANSCSCSLWYPTWSPDSGRIAYDRQMSGFMQVWIVGADGNNDHRITASVATTTAR